ncbi:MAG: GNAT family N-acetyltransferase [Propionibacteriaceae bacterium]|jgi:GNAT superfamily N-acetyltransferase|nr:GNAT family N-acetyltransferase [Propionibacteriaceae bacterium]
MNLPDGYRLVEIEPTPLDGPFEWAYRGAAEVVNAVNRAVLGTEEFCITAENIVAALFSDLQRERRAVVVEGDDDEAASVVAHAYVRMPRDEDSRHATVNVLVLPGYRRRGLGSSLWSWIDDVLRTEERTVASVEVLFGDESLEVASNNEGIAVSGVDSILADSPSVQWAMRRGFTVGQILYVLSLDLPVPEGVLERLADDARGKAQGYRTHVWVDAIPERWLEPYARLKARMATDAPAGGLEVEKAQWDAEKVASVIRSYLNFGLRFQVTVAEHIATGELAAFTELSYELTDKTIVQRDTIVDPRHRGHRLGALIKIASLEQVEHDHPSARHVWTWNAEENTHMLAINAELGFTVSRFSAEMQKRV